MSASLYVRGGRVITPNADPHLPSVRDLLIEDGRIAAIGPFDASAALRAERARLLDAGGRLVVPGFVNAHYHSYDVLAKGLTEDMPFDVWALHSQPAYFGKRRREELRIRTLLGALENLKSGITTLQDFCSLVPQDEETLDTIVAAYQEIGIRTAFSIALRDVSALDIAPFLPADMPADVAALVAGSPKDAREELAFVAAQLERLDPLPPRFSWILSPAGPQRVTFPLLEGLADLSRRHRIPLITHVYETKAQVAKARVAYPEHDGSLIRMLARAGAFGHRASLAHMIWLLPQEIELLAELGGGVIHNPLANLKIKNGIAPMARYHDRGVRIALGCDNVSCTDAENMFQAMKMFCMLAGVSDPQPTGVHAVHALAAATTGGAYALGLEHEIGTIAPGMAADITLIDLDDIAYQPLNSVTRQMVYSEVGRGVKTVLVAGEIVLDEGRSTRIDEAALRAELAEIMVGFRRDFADISARNAPAIPYLLAANDRLQGVDVGTYRYMCDCHSQFTRRKTGVRYEFPQS
jgi:5-methylthioadenosine/S-adenosylhomocysteine deaminase